MKKLRNFLGENTTAYPYRVVLVFPDLNLDDTDSFIRVSELLDIHGTDIRYNRVVDTTAMIEVMTKIDIYENIIEFCDSVLENLREDEIRVNIAFAEKR